jgi:hypothetical protein
MIINWFSLQTIANYTIVKTILITYNNKLVVIADDSKLYISKTILITGQVIINCFSLQTKVNYTIVKTILIHIIINSFSLQTIVNYKLCNSKPFSSQTIVNLCIAARKHFSF